MQEMFHRTFPQNGRTQGKAMPPSPSVIKQQIKNYIRSLVPVKLSVSYYGHWPSLVKK